MDKDIPPDPAEEKTLSRVVEEIDVASGDAVVMPEAQTEHQMLETGPSPVSEPGDEPDAQPSKHPKVQPPDSPKDWPPPTPLPRPLIMAIRAGRWMPSLGLVFVVISAPISPRRARRSVYKPAPRPTRCPAR